MEPFNEIIEVGSEIFYGLWANLLPWKVSQRAMLVIFVVFSGVELCLFLGSKILGKVLRKYGEKGINIIFAVYQAIFFHRKGAEGQMEYIQRVNQKTDKFRDLSEKVREKGYKLSKGKIIKIKYAVMLYLFCILAVSMPDIMKNIVDEEYIGTFSIGRTVYCSMEKGALKKAKKYNPLFRIVNDDSDLEQDNEGDRNEDGVWLCLTEEGVDGTNLRLGPSVKDEILVELQGDVLVKYLDEKDNWVYVEMQDGRRGWVNKNLLKRSQE